MAFPYPPITSLQVERTEQLARLIYELLDADVDTEPLIREQRDEAPLARHFSYLRDLQRIGREMLAEHADTTPAPARAGSF